jgi:GT2 family glycosyltransferase
MFQAQTHLIADLRKELEAANKRNEDASRELDLLTREKAEIEAAMDRIYRSTGWRFVTGIQKLKSRLLPPGSRRRRFYDSAMMRFAPSRESNVARPEEVPSRPAGRVASAVPFTQSLRAEPPYCSIIIPVRNRSIFTKACLLAIEKSVRADKLPYEVIVVDDGSTDDTPALLNAWCLSRVNARVLRMRQNSGFAHACNEGARVARGRYIVLLNNDTLPTPGWLEKMLELATGEPQVGIVGSKLLFPDGRIQHIGVAFDEGKNPGHIYRGFPADIRPAKVSREYQAVTGACLLVDRDLFWSVGGLDEGYENSYEDVDLCLKLRARGCRILVCAESTLYHFESISENRHVHDFRNRALLKTRWGDSIHCDLKSLYAGDGVAETSTQFVADQAHHPEQERWLEELWRRVYHGPFPQEELIALSLGPRNDCVTSKIVP